MKRTVDEILEKLRGIVGDERMLSDDVIELVEDVTDTVTTEGEDWEARYRENDLAWRKRYSDRFYKGDAESEPELEPEREEKKTHTIEELFKEVKE